MGFTVSTVSHPRSLCFYYHWLQSMRVFIILVWSRMIESLSLLLSHWIHHIPSRGLMSVFLFSQGCGKLAIFHQPFSLSFGHTCKMLLLYWSHIYAFLSRVSWSYILQASQTFFCLASEMIPKRENCPLCLFYKLVFSISHVSIFSVKIFGSSKRVLSALLCFILVLVYPEVKQNLSICDDFFLEVWLSIIVLLSISNSKNMPLYTLTLFVLEPCCIGKKNSSDVMPLGANPASRHWAISHYENFVLISRGNSTVVCVLHAGSP